MMAQLIDRRRLKAQMKDMLRSAQVSPLRMLCLYVGLLLVLNLAEVFTSMTGLGVLSTFVSILSTLMGQVLSCGFVLYCMTVRRGERAEYLTLFDGFSFVGKVILLNIVIYIFTFLWGLLFLIPGIIAGYRYRFAVYNLCDDPSIGVMEALEMSKQQTLGYKGQLFMLDVSYLGYSLLASLPTLISWIYVYLTAISNPDYYLANPAQLFAIALPLPALAIKRISVVWPLRVALLYCPVFQCVDLGYFDIAKHTSGVGRQDGLSGQDRLEDGGWDSF